MDNLLELEGKIKERSGALDKIFNEAGAELDMSKVSSIEGDSAAKVSKIQELNKELIALNEKAAPLRELKAGAELAKRLHREATEPVGQPPFPSGNGKSSNGYVETKSLGQMVTESKEWANGRLKRDAVELPDFNVQEIIGRKALFDTITGYPTESVRGPRLVMPPEYELQIADLPFQSTTTQQSIVFMRETTTTHNALEVAEGVAKPESAYAYTEETSPVRKIATWIPITDEALEDVPRIQDLLNSRLRYAVRLRLDSQLLAGNGTAPNLRGLINVVGVQTEANAGNAPDAIHRAITKVQVIGQKQPNVVVIHPNDWQQIRLLTTTDGIYLWGPPMDSGPMRIWGLPVLSTPAVPEGTAIVGAWRESAELATRKGITFSVTDSHSDYFIKNLQVILVEMRVAFVVFAPVGFCLVTGI